MTKKLMLTALVAVFAATFALAQTKPQPRSNSKTSPANKTVKAQTAKEKDSDAAKIEHAEERSNGAAFSGKGKGGDKNMVDKEGKNKGHAKGKHKNKAKSKNKGEDKGKFGNRHNNKTYEGPDSNAKTGTKKAPTTGDDNGDTPVAAPVSKQRKIGDKPVPGKETQKEGNNNRG